MSSLSSQLSGSDVGDPITLEDLCSSLDEGWSEAPKPAASSAIPHAGGPPESFSVPSLLGKRSRSQSPEAEYVHDLAVHATVSTEEDFLSTYGPSRFGGWGEYMRRKRAKLQNQNAVMQEASLYKAQLFGGIRVYVNGLTHPPLQELRKLVVEYGGIFHTYLDRKSMATHVVAEQLTPSKWKEYANLKVVSPLWIVDSVKHKKLLPWARYSLRMGGLHPGGNVAKRMVRLSQRSIVSEFLSQSKGHDSIERVRGLPASCVQTVDDNISGEPPIPEPVDDHDKLPANGVAPSRLNRDQPSYAPGSSNLHAARLMQDPKWRLENTSAGGAFFVEKYFGQSRLHYLSTWKSELKILVKNACSERRFQEQPEDIRVLRDCQSAMTSDSLPMDNRLGSFMKSGPRKRGDKRMQRFIMHCDFDCFFVSASLTNHPQLRGHPVVVCHARGEDHRSAFNAPNQSTSEVASASYEARAKGVKNGMSLRQAKVLCPEVKTLPYEFKKYKDISVKFYGVLLRFADSIEVVSVDEALIDVTSLVVREAGRFAPGQEDPAKHVAETIRAEIRKETSCEASVGIGENRLLARIATRAAKPGGSFHLKTEAAIGHLAPLPLSILPGFGRSALEKVKAKWGITTCGETREIKDVSALQKLLGAGIGAKLWNFVRGIDDQGLKSDDNRNSVSATINYAIRFDTLQQVQAFVYALGKEVSDRLRADSFLGRSLTLSVMRRAHNAPTEPPKFLGHGSCDSFSYSALVVGPGGTRTSEAEVISSMAWRLLQAHHLADVTDLRGIGISVTNLEDAEAPRNGEQSRLSFERKPTFSHEHQGPNQPSHIAEEPSVGLKVLEDDTPITPRKSSLNASTDTKRTSGQRTPTPHHTSSPTEFKGFALHQQFPACISDADLREVDIDPNVFYSLPSDIQKEQLNARRIKARTSLEDVGAISKRRDAPSRSRSRSVSVAPSMHASLTDAPDAKINARVAPVLLLKKARTIDELQDLISRWVESGLQSGPEIAATESIRDFFLRCITEQGDVAVDKVASVLKWWRFICRAHWPMDKSGMRSQGVKADDNVGQMWWHAFTTVKDTVDERVRGRFGGTLSLQ